MSVPTKKTTFFSKKSEEWLKANGNSNSFSTTERILTQALPQSLATPTGWHSELVESSVPISNDTETTSINNKVFLQNVQGRETSNDFDGPPIIYSTVDKQNHLVNEISSSTILPSESITTNSLIEHNGTYVDECSNQDRQPITVQNQQTLQTTSENRSRSPVIIHKTLPDNVVTYEQNVAVRYLQPPTPPPL